MSEALSKYLKTKYDNISFLTILRKVKQSKEAELKKISLDTNIQINLLLAEFTQLFLKHITPELQKLQFQIKYDLLKQIKLNNHLKDLHLLTNSKRYELMQFTCDEFRGKDRVIRFLQYFISTFITSIEISSLEDALNAEIALCKTVETSFQEEYQTLIANLLKGDSEDEECCMEGYVSSNSELSYDEHDCCSESTSSDVNEI